MVSANSTNRRSRKWRDSLDRQTETKEVALPATTIETTIVAGHAPRAAGVATKKAASQAMTIVAVAAAGHSPQAARTAMKTVASRATMIMAAVAGRALRAAGLATTTEGSHPTMGDTAMATVGARVVVSAMTRVVLLRIIAARGRVAAMMTMTTGLDRALVADGPVTPKVTRRQPVAAGRIVKAVRNPVECAVMTTAAGQGNMMTTMTGVALVVRAITAGGSATAKATRKRLAVGGRSVTVDRARAAATAMMTMTAGHRETTMTTVVGLADRVAGSEIVRDTPKRPVAAGKSVMTAPAREAVATRVPAEARVLALTTVVVREADKAMAAGRVIPKAMPKPLDAAGRIDAD